MVDRTSKTSTEVRSDLAAALAHDLRQLDFTASALFVEAQQAEIERLQEESRQWEKLSLVELSETNKRLTTERNEAWATIAAWRESCTGKHGSQQLCVRDKS